MVAGSDDELIKLVETSRTLCPVHHASSPATYYNPVAKEKWSPACLLIPGPQRCYTTGVDRVRGTAGGDRLPSSCPPSTQVASLPTVNILFNSVVSDDAFFGSVDLSDFYLGTDLDPPQFIKIFTHQFSSHVLSSCLNLLPFLKTSPSGKAYIVFRIDKTMYVLKEAGKLSNLRLVSLLSSFGFHETSTPCLFQHVSRPILFVLVVDDFGVKYTNRSDFNFLVSCLSTL
jgi:hypothetical protein